MKKLGLLLLLAASSALAGGAGQPPSEDILFTNYQSRVLDYTRQNFQHLPEITNCLSGKYPGLNKPEQLKLRTCGIYKRGKQSYVELSTGDYAYYTVIPSMSNRTPQLEANTLLDMLAALFKMRQKLGQPLPDDCNSTPATYCNVKHEGNKFKIYFEFMRGIRLYYNGKSIQSWPEGSEAKALSQFQNTLSAYIWANKSSLPNLVDCLNNNDGPFTKPAPLILSACGIYRNNGRGYLDIATKSGMGIFTLVDGTLPAETPKQEAIAQMTVAIEQYKMRHLLGQPAITICSSAYLSGKYCRADINESKIQNLYYESKDGIRLMYDGKEIKDWPKE